MNKEKIQNFTNSLDELIDSKDRVDGDIKNQTIGKVIEKISHAEINLFTGIKRNKTDIPDTELHNIYIKVLKLYLIISLVLIPLFFINPLYYITGAFSIIGLYNLFFGKAILKLGIARQAILLGVKARILGFIFVSFAIFIIFNLLNE